MKALPVLFEQHEIRRVYDEKTETWWFSVVDIIQVLTQQTDYQAARKIRKQTTGAAQPQLPIKTLINFGIPVPSALEVQRALVKKLRAFEPETQRLESIYYEKLAALEALKKSLLHQAFTGQL